MNNENIKIDLAKGSFIEKIPGWLRWILLIPASLIAPFLLLLIQALFRSYYDPALDSVWSIFLRSAIWGGISTFTACMFATRYQKIVAMVYLIFFSILTGGELLLIFMKLIDTDVFIAVVEIVGMLGASAYVNYYINNNLD